LGVAPNPSILTKSQYLSSKKEKKEGFFENPPSPLPLKGLHLSLCSLSSGEGKIENFEKPSFSKIW
jgi:hypothetical protein